MKVLIYPWFKTPSRYTNTLDALGIEYDNDLTSNYNVVIFTSPIDCREPLYLTQVPIINQKLQNITKTFIDEIFQSVFGYSILVTPDYKGMVVRKKNKQSSGRKAKIVRKVKRKNKLISKYDPDRVLYQKYIDTWDGGAYLDHRVFIYGEAKFVVDKRTYKLEIRRADADEYILKSLDQIFSPNEIAMINTFCLRSGLNMGEIDIIRDKDGKLYIIDINDYPTGKRALIDSPDGKGGIILDHCAKYMRQYINTLQ